jgi:hypothetical protein
MIIKNIAFWPYKDIPFSPYSGLPYGVGYPNTHVLDLADVYVLEKWTADTKVTPYPMILGDHLL